MATTPECFENIVRMRPPDNREDAIAIYRLDLRYIAQLLITRSC